jgi:hypothetical protein
VDPDLDVLGPPGSGSVIILYRSGSFHPQAKKIRKTLISTTGILWLLFVFLYVRTDVNMPSKSNKQKNFDKKTTYFLLASC